MLRRLFALKSPAPQPTETRDVFAALANLPQFSIARAAQSAHREGA